MPVWAGGDGSDGHTHAAPVIVAAPVVTTAMVAHAIATSEEFEVVASLEGKKLVLTVDRFASNEPVVKATVEVDGMGLKGVAAETAPGTYAMDVPSALAAGKHPLTITIEAGEIVDLLAATLDTSSPVVSVVHRHHWSEQIVWIVAGLLLLVSAALLVFRQRYQARKEI